MSKTEIVSLSAKIVVEYSADCDRCGNPTVKNYEFQIDKVLVTSLSNEEENDDMLVLPDMRLDLGEFVLTEVVLNIPTKHLCREDCKGICQNCGKNLNEGECGCTKKAVDPRLSILQQLLDDAETTN